MCIYIYIHNIIYIYIYIHTHVIIALEGPRIATDRGRRQAPALLLLHGRLRRGHLGHLVTGSSCGPLVVYYGFIMFSLVW